METIKDLLRGANPIIILLLIFLIWWVTNHISSRIDRLEDRMNRLETKMDENYRELNNKIDSLETKIDEKFDTLFFYLLEKDPKHLKPSTNK